MASCQTDPPPPRIQVNDTELRITMAGRPVLSYQLAEQLEEPVDGDTLPAYYSRSGFIDPVYSPAGRLITDAFPVGHSHQHGIFMAWTSTDFRGEDIDFWNQQDRTGTARHVALLETIDSADMIGFRARLQQVSSKYGPILQEDWHIRVYDSTSPYVWDLRSEQTNITDDTLFLNKYSYGGLGVRGSAEWNESDSLMYRAPASFLTDAGADRAAANHTRPAWTAIYGPLDGSDEDGTAGLAVFSHPENFRSPQFVRVHPEMPYLSVTPVVEAGFFIPPGGSYVSRYRFVIFDGEAAAANLDRFGWTNFPSSATRPLID
ncbi:hypothetical protein GGR28_001447 [Lewinella aquimaris]|uniref:Methane oxygenase PmoA n=1 Tax=Neolewinella aquimaris TaxID=1835722 RepID=A0A840E129_9BACT|nr:PmoA family protein [Neolewinella aquimaris]MBB4078830.1 hypothetical protein [Neolewinella aquimaris]